MEYAIINRGRGPEIAGSRITVYDVLAETEAGATPEELACWYELDVEQIRLALRYIDEHREEVEREWAAIEARNARGNPPHVQTAIDETHARLAPVWEELRQGNRGPLEEVLEEYRRKKHLRENGNGVPAGGHQRSGTGEGASNDS
jgi:uncharacterized protein (DUF433 family)